MVDIQYYSIHTYSCKDDRWTCEIVGVARNLKSKLVSSPKVPYIIQDDKPLMSFNPNLWDRYIVTWDSGKKKYVTCMSL